MRKLGRKQLTLQLEAPLTAIPAGLASWRLELADGGTELTYTYDAENERNDIITLLKNLNEAGIGFTDLKTSQSSLEDIFVSLVSKDPTGASRTATPSIDDQGKGQVTSR